MPSILVRDVPDELHALLLRRARAQGQSLQQYLTAELQRLADRPSLDEVLTRIDARSGGRVGLEQAFDDLAEGRRA